MKKYKNEMMQIKQKQMQYSIMAILLPSQIRNDIDRDAMIVEGGLPLNLLESLHSCIQSSWPISLPYKKRLTIWAQGNETLLTSFELLNEIFSYSSRIHLCIITNSIVRDMRCIISNENDISSLNIPIIIDTQWRRILLSNQSPQLLIISHKGKVELIEVGRYLSSSNILDFVSKIDLGI